MLVSWMKKRREAKLALKERAEKTSNDEYLTRLNNSRWGYRGHRHSGEGPFLEINEVTDLIAEELDRKTKESNNE
jgi:hypothetical protein